MCRIELGVSWWSCTPYTKKAHGETHGQGKIDRVKGRQRTSPGSCSGAWGCARCWGTWPGPHWRWDHQFGPWWDRFERIPTAPSWSMSWRSSSSPSDSSWQGSWRASTSHARGLCRSSEAREDCSNGGGGRSEELVNSKNPHSPPYKDSWWRNVGWDVAQGAETAAH
jgi:hypothetical protein